MKPETARTSSIACAYRGVVFPRHVQGVELCTIQVKIKQRVLARLQRSRQVLISTRQPQCNEGR